MAGNKRGCPYLLALLLALLVAFPFLQDIARPLILIIPMAAVFVAGVVVSDATPAQVRRALAITAVQISLMVASLLLPDGSTAYELAVAMALAAAVVLIVFATWCLMHYVLRARVITRDQIAAGICMYIMLGFAFAVVFHLLNILVPDSFTAGAVPAPPGRNPDLMYFSFVTLATLGYGDIVPRTHIARSLAILEALVGMLYIAIFMARLVSMQSLPDSRGSE